MVFSSEVKPDTIRNFSSFFPNLFTRHALGDQEDAVSYESLKLYTSVIGTFVLVLNKVKQTIFLAEESPEATKLSHFFDQQSSNQIIHNALLLKWYQPNPQHYITTSITWIKTLVYKGQPPYWI